MSSVNAKFHPPDTVKYNMNYNYFYQILSLADCQACLFSSCKILQKVKGEATVIDSQVFILCVGVGLFVITSLSPASRLYMPHQENIRGDEGRPEYLLSEIS